MNEIKRYFNVLKLLREKLKIKFKLGRLGLWACSHA
jgi:hypothetical protein